MVVSDMAVGDILGTVLGSEFVVTTLASDLYVCQLTASAIGTPAMVSIWVDGALGTYKGVWKWRQP
ncbi:MAG: hypothetical protein AB7T19_19925 [Planctomycetota bacterium]